MKNITKTSITVSTIGYKNKPTGSEMGKIQANCKEMELDLFELAEYIHNGHTFFSSNFINEKHRKETFKNSNMIVLDSDDGRISHDVFKSFCRLFYIEPNIFYKSWSDTARHNKFHAVWFIEQIDDFDTVEALSKYIYFLFSKAFPKANLDTAMYKPTQPWGGTNKGVEVLSIDYLNIHNVKSAIFSVLKTNKSRVEEDLEKFSGIKFLTNDEEGNTVLIINKKEEIKKDKEKTIDLSNSDSKVLLKNCKLINELVNDEQDYYTHNLNFNILCNLVNVQNGRDIYISMCELNGSKTTEKYKKDFSIASDYLPVKCNKYCPYADTCKYGQKTMAYASKNTAYKEVKHNPETITQIDLDTAPIQLDTFLNNSIKSNLKKELNIIEVGTGIGKTHKIIEIIKEEADIYNDFSKTSHSEEARRKLNGFIYAAPTHALAEQTYNELLQDENVKKYGMVYIKPRPVVLDKILEEELKELEADGFYEMSIDLQKEYYKTLKVVKYELEERNQFTSEEYLKVCEYIDGVKEWLEVRKKAPTAKVIICTHAYLKTMDLKSYKLINIVLIDEDITSSCLPQHKIKLDNLDNMKKVLQKSTYEYYNNEYDFEDLELIIEKIQSFELNKIYTYNSRNDLYYMKKIKNKLVKVSGMNNSKLKELISLKKDFKLRFKELLNINSIYKSDNFLHIQSINTIDLHDKKCIVFSATPAPSKLYEAIFNVSVTTEKLDRVKFKGKLIQNSNFKCFKKDLENPEYIDEIVKYLKTKLKSTEPIKIITYKNEAIRDSLRDEGFNDVMTFGATAGLNSLKGQNFVVIGTYYINPNAVNLLAGALEQEGTISNIELIKNYKVKFQDVEQLLPTFSEGFKRDYHLWQCWQNMEQSIGRARLVREDCTVILLSSMIHPLAYQD
jgi:hypothetical protein